MRLREAPRPAFDPPSLQLRRWRWTGPSPQPAGERTGHEAYRSRAAWLKARRAWERRSGRTVAAWYAEVSGQAREERGFDGWAEMRAWRPDPDRDEDEGWDPATDAW